MESISIKECIAEGWERFKQKSGLSIGGLLLMLVIQGVGGSIPIVSIFYSLLISPVMNIGLIVLFLNIRDENDPKIDNLFDGFKRFGRFLGVYWLMVLFVLIALLPGGIIIIIGAITKMNALYIAGGVVMTLCFLPVVILLCFVNYLAVDTDMPVIDCYKKSVEIAKPRVGAIILFSLAAIGINLLGLLCLIVGVIVSASVTSIAWAAFYRRAYKKEVVLIDPAVQAEPAV